MADRIRNCLVGFLVNPVAGMGGAVGLKGTDGPLLDEALKRGAKPVAPFRAVRFLSRLGGLSQHGIHLVLADGVMGCNYISAVGFKNYTCLDIPTSDRTTRQDTVEVVNRLIQLGVEVIVFVGGDGTARDLLEASRGSIPILGVPSGVKVYSSVFAVSPEAAAEILLDYCRGEGSIDTGEVIDVNEEEIQRDILTTRLYGRTQTISAEGLRVQTKESGGSEDIEGIAKHFIEEVYRPGVLYIVGPGSTTKLIASRLGISKTLLGFDAVYDGKLIGKDLTAEDIRNLISRFKEVYVVLSIIGGQGYLIGRGNQQLTPGILRLLGKERILVVSSRSKVSKLRYLLIDSGDSEVDRMLSGYYRVITGYREIYLVRALPASDPEFLRSLR